MGALPAIFIATFLCLFLFSSIVAYGIGLMLNNRTNNKIRMLFSGVVGGAVVIALWKINVLFEDVRVYLFIATISAIVSMTIILVKKVRYKSKLFYRKKIMQRGEEEIIEVAQIGSPSLINYAVSFILSIALIATTALIACLISIQFFPVD